MWWRWWWLVGCLLCALVLLGAGASAAAQPKAPQHLPSYVVIDAESGQVLDEHDADARHPAGSFNQLMLLLVSLEQAELSGLPIDVPVTIGPLAAAPPAPVASRARRMSGSGQRIPLRQNETYLLSDLLKALAITAADDAAVAVAEAIAGSVPACLDFMNARAARLGLASTTYSSIGAAKPDPAAPSDATTARALARLAQVLVRHAVVLQWSSLPGLPFHDGAVLLRNINPLVGTIGGVDGLHVSSAEDATFGIVATAQRDGLRLIAVVLGARSSDARYRLAADLLERGFAEYERVDLVKWGDRMNFPVQVLNGSVPSVTPVAGGTFSLLRRRGEEPRLDVYYQVPGVLSAPLRRDQPIGELVVRRDGEVRAVIPLLSAVNVTSTGVLAAAPRRSGQPADGAGGR
jgi:D-alanyl-D-alanine carboxypeptidase (penicillin-binding protein 5/6)